MTKINSYIFSKKALKALHEILEESIKKRIECGALLAIDYEKNDNKIIIKEKCCGEECSIKLKAEPEQFEDVIGVFHTHIVSEYPKSGENVLSITDIEASLRSGHSLLLCIGSEKTNKISCYVRKQIPYTRFTEDINNDIHAGLRKLNRLISKPYKTEEFAETHSKIAKKILEKYYNKTDI